MSTPTSSSAARCQILQSLLSGLGGEADDWEYEVSATWLGQLEKLLDIGDITGCVLPLQSPDSEPDVRFVAETAWKVLLSWYGLSEEYKLTRRPKTSRYLMVPPSSEQYILSNRHLDHVTLSVCLLDESPDKVRKQQAYFWDTYPFLLLQLRRVLDISPSREVRVWARVTHKSREFVEILQPQQVQASGSFGALVCSKLPLLVTELIKRQELPPPTASSETLSSFKSWEPPLDKVLQTMDIGLTLLVEVIGAESVSYQSLDSPVPGLNCDLLLTKHQSTWTESLDELLNTFEREVQVTAKSKRDEVFENVNQLISDNFRVSEKVKAEAEDCKKELSVRETRLRERERELDEREHELNSKVDKFKRGLTEFLMQKKKLENELKLIEEQSKFSDTRVELNVGGHRYTTSTLTLTKIPHSILALMFSGRHPLQKEADGSYFIDRDGTHFRHILNFLRDGPRSVDNVPEQNILNEILVEAEFFNLTELVKVIRDRASKSKGGPYASMPS